jgi:hypothetical protein
MTDEKLRAKYFAEIDTEVEKLRKDDKHFYTEVNKYVADTF